MNANQVVEWVFYAAITLIAGYLSNTITKLRESIEKLNVNLAIEIEKISNVEEKLEKHEIAIDKMKERITQLEHKSFNCKVANP